jgi:hypothetical protein
VPAALPGWVTEFYTAPNRVLDRQQYVQHCFGLGQSVDNADMTWVYIVASVFWGAAGASVAAWFLVRRMKARPVVDERRSFPRPPLGFRATLKLQKQDATATTIRVRGYDLTKFGTMVISNYPLVPGSVVFIEIPSVKLMGIGHVKHCRQHNLKFRIGMEFRNPLMRSHEGVWKISVVNQSLEEPVRQTKSEYVQ